MGFLRVFDVHRPNKEASPESAQRNNLVLCLVSGAAPSKLAAFSLPRVGRATESGDRPSLLERGVEVGEVQVMGASSPHPAQDGEALDNVGFVFFADPDGNGWAVQQISARD